MMAVIWAFLGQGTIVINRKERQTILSKRGA
jgi:hypothetical protein